ncbi:Ctr copper transporter [Parasponia andersonii]|uniref:Copper transport protein n=1 Tax=Parasponia andersonii TaxID=3476 RepID=A0A2P5A9V2_PARAD|nr:Ctr copper transporter [Parasponia andersonii]
MDMPGMNMSPPSSSTDNGTMMHDMGHKMMMHMTFFWGSNSEILFSGWPGTRAGMYVLALFFVFFLAVAVEWLSHCRLIKPGSMSQVGANVLQTLLHAARIGLAYMVMLAVMSFNVGVFLVAVAGHAVGFLAFGSRLVKKEEAEKVASNLPPMSC